MKKVTIALVALFLLIGSLSIEALSLETLNKITIQKFNGENVTFTNTYEMNEIANLFKDANIKESSNQDIKINPDIFVIQEYEDKKIITMGISKNSVYIKYDIEGDVYWYKVNQDKSEEIYTKLMKKLQSNIEAKK